MNVPNGLSEIVATFGDIHAYIDGSGHILPAWEKEQLAEAEIPFALELSFAPAVLVTKIRCHRLLVSTITDVFTKIADQGVANKVSTFGGCYAFRPERDGTKLSTHSWGIALDLNPESNRQGTVGMMDSDVVKIFTDAGFEWGGDWPMPRTDPMHMQFATGY